MKGEKYMAVNKQSDNVITIDDSVAAYLALNKNGGSGGGNSTGGSLLVETTFFEPVYPECPYWETTISAEEIKNAFIDGKVITIHLGHNERTESYNFKNDMYVRMVSFEEGYEIDENHHPEDRFEFGTYWSYGSWADSFSLLDHSHVGENGRLRFSYYID